MNAPYIYLIISIVVVVTMFILAMKLRQKKLTCSKCGNDIVHGENMYSEILDKHKNRISIDKVIKLSSDGRLGIFVVNTKWPILPR